MSIKTNDLFLRYKFTDRGGDRVFDAYDIEDRLSQKRALFEVRLGSEDVQWYVRNDPAVEHGGTG